MNSFNITWGKPSKWIWKYGVSFSGIRVPRVQVKGWGKDNGFIQIWKFAFVWNK